MSHILFTFLPLTFATSFFGRNVEQLGSTDGVDISYFFLLVVLTRLMAFLISVVIKPIANCTETTTNFLFS